MPTKLTCRRHLIHDWVVHCMLFAAQPATTCRDRSLPRAFEDLFGTATAPWSGFGRNAMGPTRPTRRPVHMLTQCLRHHHHALKALAGPCAAVGHWETSQAPLYPAGYNIEGFTAQVRGTSGGVKQAGLRIHASKSLAKGQVWNTEVFGNTGVFGPYGRYDSRILGRGVTSGWVKQAAGTELWLST